MNPEQAYHLRRSFWWGALLTIAHLLLPSASHSWHWLHTALSAMYLPVIFRVTLWFGSRGGWIAGGACAAAYLAYLGARWAIGGAMNPDQFAFPAVFLFVGWSSGIVVDDARWKRWQRDEIIRRANAAELSRQARDNEASRTRNERTSQ